MFCVRFMQTKTVNENELGNYKQDFLLWVGGDLTGVVIQIPIHKNKYRDLKVCVIVVIERKVLNVNMKVVGLQPYSVIL